MKKVCGRVKARETNVGEWPNPTRKRLPLRSARI